MRIFDEYLAGTGLHRIADGLNRDGILSPSGHDPARNRHRAAGHGRWAKSAVRAILTNPRYTGYEIWNKQRKDEVLVDVEDVGLGHVTKMRWNDVAEWTWSQEQMREALISTEQFDACRAIFGTHQRPATRRPTHGRSYVLAGLIRCGICGKRMHGQWNHGNAYYRCRYRLDYAVKDQEHPKTLYVKETAVVPGLDAWLGSLFDKERIEATSAALTGAAEPDPAAEQRGRQIRDAIGDCDARLARHRSLLDQGGDVAVVAGWISEVQRERRSLEAQLGAQVRGGSMTKSQVDALLTTMRDIIDVLADAEPSDKAELYAELGISLVYRPDGLILVEALPRVANDRVGGGT